MYLIKQIFIYFYLMKQIFIFLIFIFLIIVFTIHKNLNLHKHPRSIYEILDVSQ